MDSQGKSLELVFGFSFYVSEVVRRSDGGGGDRPGGDLISYCAKRDIFPAVSHPSPLLSVIMFPPPTRTISSSPERAIAAIRRHAKSNADVVREFAPAFVVATDE